MLVRVILHLVDFSRRRAGLVIVAGLALAVLATIAAATWLGVDTDTNRLISPDLPWRQREAAFDKAFPQFVDLTAVVIDGAIHQNAWLEKVEPNSEVAFMPAIEGGYGAFRWR